MTNLNVLSLFSGIGGLELGLERAGMRVVGQVEIDDYCRRVLAKHWPDVPRHDDVRTAADWWLNSPCTSCAGTPGYAGGLLGDCFCRRRARGDNGLRTGREGIEWRPRVDVVCLGFPCQDISPAGKGAGLDGERSGLWFAGRDVIRDLRPRYVVVENVAALVTRGLDRVLADLASLGFDAEWSIVSACSMGAPHTRERLFLVAHTEGVGFEWRGSARPGSALLEFEGRGPEHRRSWTAEPRPIGVAYGLPSRVDRLKGLGNSVVPQVAEYVGRLIVEHASAVAA